MKDERMDTTRERLADFVAGRLAGEDARAVEAAVEADADLRAEAAVLRALLDAKPEPPAGLAARIAGALREERRAASPPLAASPPPPSTAPDRARPAARTLRAPRWALAAAAVAVVALGTLEIVERVGPPDAAAAPLDQVALEDAPSPWVAEDGFVAGAPVLDELSDEALSSLLEELGG